MRECCETWSTADTMYPTATMNAAAVAAAARHPVSTV